mgnify:CR=1 FL=1
MLQVFLLQKIQNTIETIYLKLIVQVFNKQRKLNLHMKIHSDDAIQCDLCENKFVSEQHK